MLGLSPEQIATISQGRQVSDQIAQKTVGQILDTVQMLDVSRGRKEALGLDRSKFEFTKQQQEVENRLNATKVALDAMFNAGKLDIDERKNKLTEIANSFDGLAKVAGANLDKAKEDYYRAEADKARAEAAYIDKHGKGKGEITPAIKLKMKTEAAKAEERLLRPETPEDAVGQKDVFNTYSPATYIYMEGKGGWGGTNLYKVPIPKMRSGKTPTAAEISEAASSAGMSVDEFIIEAYKRQGVDITTVREKVK